MILVGNQRGGARNLAAHLLSPENENVEVHEVRGFAVDDVHGAFQEAHAMSKGTRCQQFLFSLSFNPPPRERVHTNVFEDAIARAEEKLASPISRVSSSSMRRKAAAMLTLSGAGSTRKR